MPEPSPGSGTDNADESGKVCCLLVVQQLDERSQAASEYYTIVYCAIIYEYYTIIYERSQAASYHAQYCTVLCLLHLYSCTVYYYSYSATNMI